MTFSRKTDLAGKPSPTWAFFQKYDIKKDGRVYLHRLRIIQTPWFGVFLHDINEPDSDQHPHDHPWNFVSIVLRGSYIEDRTYPTTNETELAAARSRWSVRHMKRGQYHQIVSCAPRTKTLIFTGRRVDSWGFLTEEGHVHWKKYLGVS